MAISLWNLNAIPFVDRGVISYNPSFFTFTDFYSSNLAGSVLWNNAQSSNGAINWPVSAWPGMIVFANFSTGNPLNIANTIILIDGLQATIIDLWSNTYQARVQMPGGNGVDRQIAVQVSNRDDGATPNWSIAPATTIAAKTVKYLPSPTIYSWFPTRFFTGNGIIQYPPPGTYSWLIQTEIGIRVYGHTVRLWLQLQSSWGTIYTVSPLFNLNYISPTLTPVSLPFGSFAYSLWSIINTALYPNGTYTLRLMAYTTADFVIWSPRATASITINNPRILDGNIRNDSAIRIDWSVRND